MQRYGHMNIYLDSTLEHAGVKGMKWGVRKKTLNPLGDKYANNKYNKYRKKGLNDKEATRKANRRVKINRAITAALVGGPVVGTLGYYGSGSHNYNYRKSALYKENQKAYKKQGRS